MEGTSYDYPEEIEWNSKLLRSKAHRQRIEDNVNALQNRITYLENEEIKLLTKIEETKARALEVIKIKRNARTHNEMVEDAKQHQIEVTEMKAEQTTQMKNELGSGLQQAYVDIKNLH